MDVDSSVIWALCGRVSNEIEKANRGSIVGRAHCFAVRVYIEDTDLGGVVFYANYLRFLERARSDLLRTLGIDQRAAFETGQGIYAVVELRIKYCRPARLDDELTVKTEIREIHGAFSVLQQRIFRGTETIADASVTIAFLGANGRPKRQPAEWVGKFRASGLADSSAPAS